MLCFFLYLDFFLMRPVASFFIVVDRIFVVHWSVVRGQFVNYGSVWF